MVGYADCDVVIAEKPMGIDCKQVRRVQEAERKSGRRKRSRHPDFHISAPLRVSKNLPSRGSRVRRTSEGLSNPD